MSDRAIRVTRSRACIDSPASANGASVTISALNPADSSFVLIELSLDESVVGWALKVNGEDWPPASSEKD